jgi:hypothetical protein
VVGRRTVVHAALADPIEVVDFYAPPPVQKAAPDVATEA